MPLLHIDTDMGVDDGLALVLAARLEGVRIAAVSTVFGNVPLERVTQNALIFQRLLYPEVQFPVWVGAPHASDGSKIDARDIHGDDGLGGAVAKLDHDIATCTDPSNLPSVTHVTPPPGVVIIVGLGPATNIPALVERYGRTNIERIVLMSGAVFDLGNITPFAEFNAYGDPLALQHVLSLGIPVTMVPLDICRKILLLRTIVQTWRQRPSSALADLLVNSHMPYIQSYKQSEGVDGCFPHDTIAMIVAIRPSLFYTIRGRIDVISGGTQRGRTIFHADESSHTYVAMGGDLKWVRNHLSKLRI